jgi:hypothetical protein
MPTSVLHVVGSQPPPVSSGNGTNATPVLQVIGGKGGDTSDPASNGGTGASVITQAGNGGNNSGHGVAGTGGNVIVQAGNGGSGDFGHIGADVIVQAGSGGSGLAAGGSGGSIRLQAGAVGAGPGGAFRGIISLQNADLVQVDSTEDFDIDAPSFPGGRLVVTKNGDVRIGTGVSGPGIRLDVVGRSRFRQNAGAGNTGGTNSAGFWLFQNTPNADRAFVGMETDNSVGFYGDNGGGWSLVMNTATGNVGIGTDPSSTAKLKVDGGDAAITKQGNGIILRAIDGALCFRLTVNNVGALGTTSVPCP